MNPRRVWQAFRWTLGVILLALAIRQVDWRAVGSVLVQADGRWVIWALLAFLATLLLKIIRWGWLMGVPLDKWLGTLSAAFLVGQAANILLPVRGGEVIRLGWLTAQAPRKGGEPASDSLEIPVQAGAALVMEKYLDLLALLILLTLLLPILPDALLERARKWLLPLGIAATLIVLGSLWILPAVWKRASPFFERRMHWKIARSQTWMEQLNGLRTTRRLLPAVAFTALIWLTMWVTNLLVLRALDLPLTLPGAALSLALVYAGLIPAVMPGNFGPFYFFAMQGLAPFGVQPAGQAAFAILLHLLVTLPPLLLAGGLLLIPRLGKREAL